MISYAWLPTPRALRRGDGFFIAVGGGSWVETGNGFGESFLMAMVIRP
jgi:hypothetical protein